MDSWQFIREEARITCGRKVFLTTLDNSFCSFTQCHSPWNHQLTNRSVGLCGRSSQK